MADNVPMANPLATYLSRERVSHSAFARRLGVTDSAVWRWAHGERKPGLSAAFAIEKATGGEIEAQSWFNGKRRRAA